METISYNQLKEAKRAPQELGIVAVGAACAGEKPYDFDWREAALCAQGDPDEFFPGRGASVKQLKEQCGRCKVRDECLETALAVDSDKDDHGVWGGTTERERRKMRKDRKLQRQSERAA